MVPHVRGRLSCWAPLVRSAVETAEVGRTTVGANQLPAAAVFASVEDEIAFVGKAKGRGPVH